MKIFEGDIKLYESDACYTCLYPGTCAKLELLREESRQNDDLDYTELIISKCPNRKII